MILSIWRNLWSLFVGKKSTSSFTFSLRYWQDIVNKLYDPFLLEIWHFKESCNLIHQQHFRPQLENQNFSRNGSGDEISITRLVSTSDYFYEKIMTKIFKKSNNPKKKIAWKKGLSVFKYSNYLPPCQKSEKQYWATSENNAEQTAKTDWLTDRQWLFYRTLLGRGSKKMFF